MARLTTKRICYSDELAQEICDAIAESHHGLRALCRQKPHWPRAAAIYDWLNIHPFFADLYARAKDKQAEGLVDEIMEIASNDDKDVYVDNEGQPHFNNVAIQRARLKIDSIKWIACKLKPRKYGEKNKDDDSKDNDDFVSRNRDAIDNG